MTRDQLIEMVLARLGQRQKDAKLQKAAVSEGTQIQINNLERADFKPWFLLSDYEETTVKGGEYKVTLPERFLEEWEEGSLWYVPDPTNRTERIALPKKDYDLASARFPGSGAPRCYSLAESHFLLAPIPPDDILLQMRYYKGELVMSEDYNSPDQVVPENAWTKYASDWYMGELGLVLATFHTRDADAAATFSQYAQAAKHRVYVETIARIEANANRVM